MKSFRDLILWKPNFILDVMAIYCMAQKFYMEFNFTVSGRTVKLKSVNCLVMEIYYTANAMTLSMKLGYRKVNFLSK